MIILFPGDLQKTLDALAKSLRDAHLKLDKITAQEEKMMTTLDDLEPALAGLSDTEDIVVALLDTIHAELDASKTDPAKIQALLDKIAARKVVLAAAAARDPA